MSQLFSFLAQRKKAVAALLAPFVVKGLAFLLPHLGVRTTLFDLGRVTSILVAVIGAICVHELTNKPDPTAATDPDQPIVTPKEG